MRVTIRLFGRLHDLAGAADLTRDVPAASTAGSVWEQVLAEYPSIAPYRTVVSAAVNAEFAKMNAPVGEGDEIAFLPPVSGG